MRKETMKGVEFKCLRCKKWRKSPPSSWLLGDWTFGKELGVDITEPDFLKGIFFDLKICRKCLFEVKTALGLRLLRKTPAK